ncbi:hypothetical protein ACJJTC_016374 [Scirpophaga incertulas]
MAASGRRRGPAPIASFDHDGSDEVRPPSSPETKNFRLPEIHEDSSSASASGAAEGGGAEAVAARARSASTPGLAPAAPRIDISRASSSSHQDSRDSSPELALAGGGLGFREDGALDLRSSTEELAFLESAAAGAVPAPRRHSRKDSQGSEAALLAVSGRTSRLSSVGSQCSAHSALSAFSRVSRLSVASGASRSPSPHKMLLETSFCGPKPIETEPEICAAAEERLLELVTLPTCDEREREARKLQEPWDSRESQESRESRDLQEPRESRDSQEPRESRDCRRVRTEATVERVAAPTPVTATPLSSAVTSPAAASGVTSASAPSPAPLPAIVQAPLAPVLTADDDKKRKETKNRAKAEERQARSRERRDPAENRTKSRSKDIIRIRLKPDNEYDDDDVIDLDEEAAPTGPVTAASAARAARPTDLAAERAHPHGSRTPSPSGAVVSRKSSFCSLFKSRETIASPDSPSDAQRRKKSLNDGRSRSRSRDRSTTPTSTAKIRGSVLSLFRTPRKSATSPCSRSNSPAPAVAQAAVPTRPPPERRGERLKYYEDAKDGIIHIPLRTPPGEARTCNASGGSAHVPPVSAAGLTTVSSSPPVVAERRSPKPIQRTVLPDGSIIIPLHSPTERTCAEVIPSSAPTVDCTPDSSRPSEDKSNDTGDKSSGTGDKSSGTGDKSSGTGDDERRQSSGSEVPGAASTAESPRSPPQPEPPPAGSEAVDRPHRRERLVFSTNVGSRDQVFSTQFSITKTPSVTSEVSGSFPSFQEAVAASAGASAACSALGSAVGSAVGSVVGSVVGSAVGSAPGSPADARDSSGSEASSEAAPARSGSDVEQRGLVVQESFEELPYVPTTLPQERSLALPMVPVRERGGVRTAARGRPRPPPAAAARAAPVPAPPVPAPLVPALPVPAPPAAPERIRIQLPRRPRAASAAGASALPARPERTRTRSGSEGIEARPKGSWIDFEEVPERRKQPKRIQTLPAAARELVSYAAPEDCRCECHARPHEAQSEECGEHAQGGTAAS